MRRARAGTSRKISEPSYRVHDTAARIAARMTAGCPVRRRRTVLRPYRTTDPFGDEKRKLTSASARLPAGNSIKAQQEPEGEMEGTETAAAAEAPQVA